ncbi:MAG: hypothetical protein IT328_25140 [Caldilineaceae bacterium]|nr:hypothetical protein [Caldilineaceae bacterium]
MNEYFSFNDLETLIAHQGKPAVSIYLPTSRIPTRVQAESLQFKNLLREAEEQLAQFDLRSTVIREMLGPAQDLIRDAEFWRHQKDGLAVFIAENTFLRYQLPYSFETKLMVAESFHVKPLIPYLTNDGTFYILAVSQNDVRLLRGSRFSVDEVDADTFPTSLAEALRFDEPEKQLQFHTSTSTPGSGRRDAIFHGHGGGATNDDKERIRRFFDQIDQGLREFLQDETAPLVFAGVDYLLPIYREANTYPHLVELGISGNPESLREEALHREAWRIVAPIFAAAQVAAIEEYQNLIATGRTATNLQKLVPAADQGRVGTAFVARNDVVWGVYDAEKQQVEIHEAYSPHNRDLTDLFAVYTILRDGAVYVLDNTEMRKQFNPNVPAEKSSEEMREEAHGEPPAKPVAAAIYRY